MAVLRASARLDTHDALYLDRRAAPAHPNLMSEHERVAQPLAGQAENFERLRFVETDPLLEDLASCCLKNVAGHRSRVLLHGAPASGDAVDAVLHDRPRVEATLGHEDRLVDPGVALVAGLQARRGAEVMVAVIAGALAGVGGVCG